MLKFGLIILMYPKVIIITILNFRTEMSNAHEILGLTFYLMHLWSNINDISDLSKDKDYMRSFKVNVKTCPLCKEKVNKNGGCNAMTCRCGHHFCWLCLKPNPYSQHTCKTVALQVSEITTFSL